MNSGERLLSRPSREDILAFSQELADGQIIRAEDFISDTYLDELIDKPWGHEYRVYADLLVDVWKLTILPGQSTSMHCHPRKETTLLCLKGTVRINFLHASQMVSAGNFVSIPKGVFHSTDSIGAEAAHLIEVETPRNKFDLVRKKDKYGRQGQHYESAQDATLISPMQADQRNPYAKLRELDLDEQFEFKVQAGANLIGDRIPSLICAISLSLEEVLNQSIKVFTEHADFVAITQEAKPYLFISHA